MNSYLISKDPRLTYKICKETHTINHIIIGGPKYSEKSFNSEKISFT